MSPTILRMPDPPAGKIRDKAGQTGKPTIRQTDKQTKILFWWMSLYELERFPETFTP